MGVESNTCGVGCGRGSAVNLGFSNSLSYIEGWRGPGASDASDAEDAESCIRDCEGDEGDSAAELEG